VCFHKKGYFYFWTDKMEPRWFFWELFVIARKVCLMLSVTYLPDHVELGWLLGVLTLIAASTMHAFAMPFMDEHIDSCEQFALLGAVLTYMAGLVFTYEAATCTRLGDDISDADEDADDNCLSKSLEYFAAIVIIATCVLSIYAEVRMIFKRQAMAKDYSEYMDKEVQKLKNANKKTVKMYEAQAKEMVERDENRKKGKSDANEVKFENPVVEADDPENGKKKKGNKGKKGKKDKGKTETGDPTDSDDSKKSKGKKKKKAAK